MTLDRRRMMLAAGAALFAPAPLNRLFAAQKGGPTRKVLFFTKSSGFPHSVVNTEDGSPAHAEKILTELGKEHGFEVVASKDGRMFDPDKIGQWDAFAFETTGDLTKEGTDKTPPISADGEKAFYDAILSGKGFVGIHCATDTFGHHRKRGADDPYIQMIGGEFAGHGSQQKSKIRVASPDFPGAKAFGSDTFEIMDEWYTQKNWADDLHVILTQVTEGMKKTGNDFYYSRPDFPETWARMHGKGRVFYTSMGHREDVWANPMFQGLLLGALGWATGRVDADVTPNLDKVTPGYKEQPSLPKPDAKKKSA
ncbi:ThuA domain-containing protein [Tundrisphaera sp. TA3]|uniref:ThuA domain-containing protein n=1 Tax=Tundrisphaera sp. TA3 TaxID=3435775 RepID=UPI003EB8F13A